MKFYNLLFLLFFIVEPSKNTIVLKIKEKSLICIISLTDLMPVKSVISLTILVSLNSLYFLKALTSMF